jgi:hypothetical protein
MSLGRSLLSTFVLIALLVGLVATDRTLDRIDQEQRNSRVQVRAFLSEEESADLLVAAITVTTGDGRSFLYGRTDGVWRCLDLHRAPASEAHIAGLLDAVREARGIVQTRDSDLAVEYGFGTDRSWRVTFHGPALMKDPDRDVRLEVEVGSSRPSVDGCFLRRPGQDAIWAVDTNPRAFLDDVGGGVPLLDPTLVPSVFPGVGHTVVAAEVERSDGTRYSLVMRKVEVTPEEAALGSSGIRWVLTTPGADDRAVNPILSISYLSFLRLAAWQSVLDPARLPERGMDTPVARVVLRADDGRTLALVIGPPGEQGLHAVVDATLQCAYLINSEIADLLAPDPQRLIFPGKNPWERWLRP